MVQYTSPLIYSVTLDPNRITGGDNAIQVMDVTAMEQIGEWCQTNTVEGQMKIIMDILCIT